MTMFTDLNGVTKRFVYLTLCDDFLMSDKEQVRMHGGILTPFLKAIERFPFETNCWRSDLYNECNFWYRLYKTIYLFKSCTSFSD